MPEIKPPRVLIVGCGLGGATLAQSLRARSIPFDIFERDESPTSRAQGWTLSLKSDILDELSTLARGKNSAFPPLETVSNTYSLGKESGFASFDARTMAACFRQGAEHGSPFIRASRSKLRAWLMTGLEVRWGKRFAGYEVDEQEQHTGSVKAFFEDGTCYRGDILVGADGVMSRVRNQLSGMRPANLPFGALMGEIVATREQYESWMQISTSLFTGATADGRVTVALKDVAAEKESANYYWILGWEDKDAQREDYWTMTASKQAMHEHLQERLQGLHPTFANVLRATPVEGMMHPPLRLRDMIPPELPQGRITLIGDAVHPMTPFRGAGGNSAMIDAFHLAERIAAADGSFAERLKEYEKEMTSRTTEHVLVSRANCFGVNNR